MFDIAAVSASLGKCVTLPSLPPSPEITELRGLLALKLSHNRLTQLPVQIFQLHTLTHLDLDNNQLQGDFTDAVGMLTCLCHLSIAENRIHSLPPELFTIESLEELFVDGNSISVLPENVGSLVRLRTLSATRNDLTHLPRSLGGLRKLRMLNVASNRLEALPVELCQCEMLEVLDCRKNTLITPPQLPPTDKLSEVVLGMNRCHGSVLARATAAHRPLFTSHSILQHCLAS